jgi:ankyrin repeat protein
VDVVNELLSPNDSNGTTTILGNRKSRGVDIDAKDSTGNTPLHVASLGGHLPVVKALLSGGMDVLAVNDQEGLPIPYAVDHRKLEVSKYLLQQLYAKNRRLPLHKLLQDLTWIGNPNNVAGDHRFVLRFTGMVRMMPWRSLSF